MALKSTVIVNFKEVAKVIAKILKQVTSKKPNLMSLRSVLQSSLLRLSEHQSHSLQSPTPAMTFFSFIFFLPLFLYSNFLILSQYNFGVLDLWKVKAEWFFKIIFPSMKTVFIQIRSKSHKSNKAVVLAK